MITRLIEAKDDERLAEIIRANFVKYKLDIPGTAYFDPELDHLSEYYAVDPANRRYYVMTEDDGRLVGGIGLSRFDDFEDCAEMQKLYLSDEVKGRGLGKQLVELLEDAAREMGFKDLYLETHSNLDIAINLYRKLGFKQIPKPDCVKHGTMDHFFIKRLV